MTRRDDIQGTKAYLFWSAGLFVAGLVFVWDGWLVGWLDPVWDGWLPRRGVLAKHPWPDDGFYLFNQITGTALLLAAGVCGYIHHVVK